MRKYLMLTLLVLCCIVYKGHAQNNIQEGAVVIDYRSLHMQGGELLIRNINNEVIGKFTSDSIFIKTNKYKIEKLRRKVFYGHFKSLAFYPEYYIVVLKGKANDENRIEISLDGESAFVDSEYASFETYEEHLKDQSVSLSKKSPLKKEMDDSSETISTYLDYSYVVLDIEGEWLKVECDKEVFGLDFKGYVRWRVNDDIAVSVLYSY